MTQNELSKIRKRIAIYDGEWVFAWEDDGLCASVTSGGKIHDLRVSNEIDWMLATIPMLERDAEKKTDAWYKFDRIGNREAVNNIKAEYIEISNLIERLKRHEQRLQNEIKERRSEHPIGASRIQESRRRRLRDQVYPRLRDEAIELSEEEQSLLSNFIFRLPDNVVERVVLLDNKIGGTVAHTIILQADLGDADRTLLVEETFSGVLAELYRPFLDLDSGAKNNLMRLSEDAFLKWLKRTYQPYIEERIELNVEQELEEAGLTLSPEDLDEKPEEIAADTPPRKSDESSENIFRRRIGIYEVRFMGGEPAVVRELVGMKHIAMLLESPREEIPVEDFLYRPEVYMDETQALEDGLSPGRMGGDRNLDEKGRDELKKKVKRILNVDIPALRKNKEEAEARGHMTEVGECVEEIEKKEEEVQRIAGRLKGGGYWTQDPLLKKGQNAVRKNIMDSLKKLDRNRTTAPFAEHFRKYLKGGNTFSYNPPEEEHWLTR